MERQRYYEFRVDLSMDKLSPARFHLERIICHINVPQRGSTTNQRENRKKLKIWSGDSYLFSIDDLLTLNDHPVFEKKIGKPSL